jgi:lipoyl(octanoyl) transferase
VIDLGRRPFDEVWRLQLDMVAQRQRDEIEDGLILVEHPEVITRGRGSHPQNLVAPGDVPVFDIERGGDITFHGPGQLVGYPVLLLGEGERDLHRYLRNLEEAMIRTARELGVPAARKEGMTGVWTEDAPPRKLVSIGVACKRWVTLHGFALNVTTDLSRFALINPCGMDPAVMGSLSLSLGRHVGLDDVKTPAVRHLGETLGRAFLDEVQPARN